MVYFGWIFDCRRLCTVCTLCKQVVWSDFKDLPVLMWVCTLCALWTLQSFYNFCYIFDWIFDYRKLCTFCTLCTTSFWSYFEDLTGIKLDCTLCTLITLQSFYKFWWILAGYLIAEDFVHFVQQIVSSDFEDLADIMWVCTLCALCTLQSFL